MIVDRLATRLLPSPRPERPGSRRFTRGDRVTRHARCGAAPTAEAAEAVATLAGDGARAFRDATLAPGKKAKDGQQLVDHEASFASPTGVTIEVLDCTRVRSIERSHVAHARRTIILDQLASSPRATIANRRRDRRTHAAERVRSSARTRPPPPPASEFRQPSHAQNVCHVRARCTFVPSRSLSVSPLPEAAGRAIYVADADNNRVRRIDPATREVVSVGGSMWPTVYGNEQPG